MADKIRKQYAPARAATDEKDHVRQQFEQAIIQMAIELGDLAEKSGNAGLARRTELTPSGLAHASADALLGIGEEIINLFKSNVVGLVDSDTDIAAVEGLVDKYRGTKSAPRQAISGRASETATLPMLLRDTTRLLHKRLDRFMKPLRKTHREFYAGYRSIRISIHRGRSSDSTLQPTPVTGSPATPGSEAPPQAAA